MASRGSIATIFVQVDLVFREENPITNLCILNQYFAVARNNLKASDPNISDQK
jgi:hypothetical protein